MENLQEFIETFNVICPACRGKVKAKDDGSGIACLECRRVYPVKDGIPSLVVEDAAVENEEPAETA